MSTEAGKQSREVHRKTERSGADQTRQERGVHRREECTGERSAQERGVFVICEGKHLFNYVSFVGRRVEGI